MIERLTKGVAPSLLDTEKANEIIDAINAILNSKGENGIEVKSTTAGGLTISKNDGAGSLRSYSPFEITNIDSEFVSINPGTVNNELVTPVGGVEYDAKSTPQYLSIEVKVSNDSVIESAEFVIDGDPPDAFELEKNKAPGDCKILVATLTDLSFFQVLTGNLTLRPIEAFKIPKEEVDIGEYDHDVYYIWDVGSAV